MHLDKQIILKLLIDSIYWQMAYDDANPDIGFGPTVESMYDDTIRRLELDTFIDIEPREKIMVINRVKKLRNQE